MSGKYEKKSPCQLMLWDYPEVIVRYANCKGISKVMALKVVKGEAKLKEEGKNKNRLEVFLDWLLERGENRKTRVLCRHCKKRNVEWFSVRYSYGGDFAAGVGFTACGECKEELLGENVVLYPFKFSVLMGFKGGDRKRIARLFCSAFDIEKVQRKRAFDLFAEDY